eukprot:g15603.t1
MSPVRVSPQPAVITTLSQSTDYVGSNSDGISPSPNDGIPMASVRSMGDAIGVFTGAPSGLVWTIPKLIIMTLLIVWIVSIYYPIIGGLYVYIFFIFGMTFFSRSRIWLGLCTYDINFFLTPKMVIKREVDICNIKNKCITKTEVSVKKVEYLGLYLQTVKYRVVEGYGGDPNIISYNGPRQEIQARNEIYRLPHMIELLYQPCINVRAICCKVEPPSRNFVVIGAVVEDRYGERRLIELSRRAYLFYQVNAIFDIGYAAQLWFEKWNSVHGEFRPVDGVIEPAIVVSECVGTSAISMDREDSDRSTASHHEQDSQTAIDIY